MKYTPRQLDPNTNVNVSNTNPLKEFLQLATGLVALLFAVYLILGFILEGLLLYYEPQVHSVISRIYSNEQTEPPTSEEEKLQKLLDSLLVHAGSVGMPLKVEIAENPDVNAFALPGGRILVYRGLLDHVESENELAMILAHEIGHFANQDHLRRLGRSLVLMLISAVLTGEDSVITSFTQSTLGVLLTSYSKDQELAADSFALDVIYKRYGHVGGSTDFFRRLMNERYRVLLEALSNTHPASEDRVLRLEALAAERNYPSQEPVER